MTGAESGQGRQELGSKMHLGPHPAGPQQLGLTVRRSARDLGRELAWSDRATRTLVQRISPRGPGGCKAELGAVVVTRVGGDGDQQWSGSR